VKTETSRRSFLATGLVCRDRSGIYDAPALYYPLRFLSSGVQGNCNVSPPGQDRPEGLHRPLRLHITSDPTVISRAVDMGINLFRYLSRVPTRSKRAQCVGRRVGALSERTSSDEQSRRQGQAGALRNWRPASRSSNTDYLDVWHLHGTNSRRRSPMKLLEAQRTAKQQGKIRFLGEHP